MFSRGRARRPRVVRGQAVDGRDEFDRTPPQDVEAERSALGAMLLSKEAISEVSELLRTDDFYRPVHGMIYDVLLTLFGKNEPADAITVAAELNRRGELARVGGPDYLHTLIAGVPTAANAVFYAEIVRERAMLRRLVEVGTRIVQLGYAADGGDAQEIVNQAQAEVYAATESRQRTDYVRLQDTIWEVIEEAEAIKGGKQSEGTVATGFIELDKLTNGLHPGQMIIVAARPGGGKSTFALDVCRNAAIRHNQAAVVFSLEMSAAEITMRLLSAESTIFQSSLRNGQITDEQLQRLGAVAGKVGDAPLFIDDSPNLTMPEIRAKARRLKQEADLKLIVVDYLQLMSSGRRVESRQQEVSEFSRALKLLAKELEVPLIAVAQLNRSSEQRADKKPTMADLRESGSLEQDADIVILLHKPNYEKESEREGEVDIIVDKHRAGATATIPVLFQGHYSRFVDKALE
ncbi:replicative DNA helicase [Buchananella hordeovulneris]|nr:replicative DNA helicase [Buchananella hordeovulneris]RRD50503.1 replicative DNA helicase [Buchananella hordeovulneris]